MELRKYYILSIIIIAMLTSMSFEVPTTMFMENHQETNIEASLEEKGPENKLDEKLVTNDLLFSLKRIEAFTDFDPFTPLVDQFYLNNIFKPPIFS